MNREELTRRLRLLNIVPTVDRQKLLSAANRIKPDAAVPVAKSTLGGNVRTHRRALLKNSASVMVAVNGSVKRFVGPAGRTVSSLTGTVQVHC
jgi:hypothetical protein